MMSLKWKSVITRIGQMSILGNQAECARETEKKLFGGENELKMKKGINKCPVCGMMVDDTWSSEYKGKTYYFMNSKHKEMFEANPTRYVN